MLPCSIPLVSHHQLLYRRWNVNKPKAVIMAIHGLGAQSARWEDLGVYFAKRQVEVWAIELKGFGQTNTLRGDIDSFRTYVHDIEYLKKLIVTEHGTATPLYLMGESLGGLISLYTQILLPLPVKGLVLISPALKNNINFSVWAMVGIALARLICPRARFRVPFKPAMITQDEAVINALNADPYEHNLASARLIIETMRVMQVVWFNASKINTPILLLQAEKDLLINADRNLHFFERLPQLPESRFKLYPDMSHALTIDTEREKVFADIYEWLNLQTHEDQKLR